MVSTAAPEPGRIPAHHPAIRRLRSVLRRTPTTRHPTYSSPVLRRIVRGLWRFNDARMKRSSDTPIAAAQNAVARPTSADSWIESRNVSRSSSTPKQAQPGEEQADHAGVRVDQRDPVARRPRLRLGSLGPVQRHTEEEELPARERTDLGRGGSLDLRLALLTSPPRDCAGGHRATKAPPPERRPLLVGERDVSDPQREAAHRHAQLSLDLAVRPPLAAQLDGAGPQLGLGGDHAPEPTNGVRHDSRTARWNAPDDGR